MKRLFSIILAICLITGMAIPARATEDTVEEETSTNLTVVSSLEELQVAIDDAQDGDTISVAGTIVLDGHTLKTNMEITITRHDSFESNPLFILYDNSVLDGFNIIDTFGSANTVILSSWVDAAYIQNCTFRGNNTKIKPFIKAKNCEAIISDCSFMDNIWFFVECSADSDCIFNGCTFSGSRNGAISVLNGKAELNRCTITDNYTHNDGAISSISGEVTIKDCIIKNNLANESTIPLDIYSRQGSTLTIEGNEEDGSGYYDKLTGMKIELPLAQYTEDTILLYLNDEVAAQIFAPDPDDNAPEGDEEDPTEGEETEDNTNDNPETPPSEETQDPESGDEIINPDDTENQPDAPNKEDNTDDPTEEEIPSAAPQEPSDNDDSDEDDYTPPASHRPVYRPTKPIVVIPEPEPAPALACGDAVIDTSRSVILEGYGDGLLHLEDNLTRAQMATIIYRLLDADSIEKYDDATSVFADVLPDAWYCRYVSTIARAGIVCGTGNGNYAPNAPLTWGHIVTVMSRFVEAKDYKLQNISYDGWALQPIKTAVALGWIEDNAAIDPDSLITRGEFVAFVNSVLELYR